MPLASILIPCFRSRAFVARAVTAALAQTCRDLEVVVVDNASDDGTAELVAGLAAADPRVRLHRGTENVGPVRNWRRAASLARGELAALCFADDWFEPAFVERGAAALRDPQVGFALSAVLKERPGRPAEVEFALPGPPVRPTRQFLAALYEGRGPEVPWSPGCALFRRADLVRWLERPLPEEASRGYLVHGAGPDVHVYLQACLAYPAFAHLGAPLVHFLDHGGNLSRRPEVRRAYLDALEDFLAASPSAPVDRRRARAVSWVRSRLAGRPAPLPGPACWPQLLAFLASRLLARRAGPGGAG